MYKRQNLFSVPLGTAGEAAYARPTITVPVSVECDFYGRNVVQVPGPIASQSGAGFVGAGSWRLYLLVGLMQRWRPLAPVPWYLCKWTF